MARKHPKEWKLRTSKCTLNGASCFYRHYPACELTEALTVKYPKTADGKIRPYKPSYENGTGKPCYDKPADLPEPKVRDRSSSPVGAPAKASAEKGATPKSADALRQRIAKHETLKPRCCAAMLKDGSCAKDLSLIHI